MKKIGTLFVVAAMLAAMVLTFTACGENTASGSASSTVGGKTFKSMGFEVFQPEGWSTQTDSNNTIITPPGYPDVGDTIKVTVSDKISDFSTYTEDYIKTTYGKAYTGFSLKSYDKTTVDGYDAVKIKFSYTLNGKELIQDQTIVNANSCYIFSFIDESRKNTSVLENAMASIKVEGNSSK